MNIPSHLQTGFFHALDARDDVDLKVCYFDLTSAVRAAEGWNGTHTFAPYETHCKEAERAEEMVEKIPDWLDRVHLINHNFSVELIELFCANQVLWCHWSEMPGVRLAEYLNFRVTLFRVLNPFMLAMKRHEGMRIKQKAIGAFGQGILARTAFRRMGVPTAMLADLFYAISPLTATTPSEKVKKFAKGRNVFLSVAALCKRKGIDILLKALAHLDSPDWCLVLCGLDKENGAYKKLVESLNLQDRVLFLGSYPNDKIAEVYAASDVFILASRFDGWGAVLNEAASLGIPLIGTDLCGASWHAIDDGCNGFRVQAGSVNSLTSAMRVYVDNPSLFESHGIASSEIFFNELAPKQNAEKLVEVLAKWGVCES